MKKTTTITEYELFHVKKAFHHHSNVHFFRNEDGSVTIMSLLGETTDGTSSNGFRIFEIGFEHTIGPDSWASIVCAVSKEGATSKRFKIIETFHQLVNP
jgi:hypothetical protein